MAVEVVGGAVDRVDEPADAARPGARRCPPRRGRRRRGGRRGCRRRCGARRRGPSSVTMSVCVDLVSASEHADAPDPAELARRLAPDVERQREQLGGSASSSAGERASGPAPRQAHATAGRPTIRSHRYASARARRSAVRHRHPADRRDAAGDGRRRGRRRRLRRGPHRRALEERVRRRWSARRPRCSCRRGRWPTRSRCACSAGPAPTVVGRPPSHVVVYETGASARNGPSPVRTLVDDADGALDARRRRVARRGGGAPPRRGSSAVCVENTHMPPAATPWPLDALDAVAAVGLPVHLDGARLFNAEVATGVSAARLRRAGDHRDVLPVEGARRAGRVAARRRRPT